MTIVLLTSMQATIFCFLLIARVFHHVISAFGGNHLSEICAKTQDEIHHLLLNQAQLKAGIQGNGIIPSDCKKLVTANVMNERLDEEQQLICANSCFPVLTMKYKTLLDNHCFDSTDSDEEKNGKMIAASYQVACQTNMQGEYCMPMLARLVESAGDTFDHCNDIAGHMGCCFQSYKQYVHLWNTKSADWLTSLEEKCQDATISTICPCGPEYIFNVGAFNGTTICSLGHPTRSYSILILSFLLLLGFIAG